MSGLLTLWRTTKESLDFIQKFIDFQPKSRNAQLARLDLIHWDFLSGNLKDEELFAACQEYLDRNKTKLYCFADLIKYLAVLNKAFLGRIIEYAKTQVDDKEVSGRMSVYQQSDHCSQKAHPKVLR